MAIAFNAGNLKPVARSLRTQFPALNFIICSDDDLATEGNPGLTKATAAALAIGGKLAIPEFGSDRTDAMTDFNDMAGIWGLQAVARSLSEAKPPTLDKVRFQGSAGAQTWKRKNRRGPFLFDSSKGPTRQ